MSTTDKAGQSFWRSPGGITLLVFLGAAAVFLWSEHRTHALGALPYLLLLICVFMHVFMHRGHGGQGGGSHDTDEGDRR